MRGPRNRRFLRVNRQYSARSCTFAFPIPNQNIEKLVFMPDNSRAKQERSLSYSLPHNFVQESLFERKLLKRFVVNYTII